MSEPWNTIVKTLVTCADIWLMGFNAYLISKNVAGARARKQLDRIESLLIGGHMLLALLVLTMITKSLLSLWVYNGR